MGVFYPFFRSPYELVKMQIPLGDYEMIIPFFRVCVTTNRSLHFSVCGFDSCTPFLIYGNAKGVLHISS